MSLGDGGGAQGTHLKANFSCFRPVVKAHRALKAGHKRHRISQEVFPWLVGVQGTLEAWFFIPPEVPTRIIGRLRADSAFILRLVRPRCNVRGSMDASSTTQRTFNRESRSG